jgi:macrolide transport system ATP-binding/permease protein
MSPAAPPLLEIRGLSKIYRPAGPGGPEVRALDDLTLRIEQGEYLAIVGPSGSGKSTLMQILGLLDRPTDGKLLLAGHDIAGLSDDQLALLRNRNIGFIFQFFNLLARTSALNNVALPLIYARVPDIQAKAQALLKKVGMEEREHHAPHQLSGGQQQRVAIARALANHPSLLFADEPTGNISSQQAEEVMQELDELNSQGVTVILVTHEPDIAAHAKRVLHMKDGKVVSDEVQPSRRRAAAKAGTERPSFAIPKVSALPSMASLVENLRMAMTALSLNKVRTALTMLGVIIGVAAVIAITAISNGAKEAVNQRLAALGTNLMMVIPGNQNAFGMGSAPRFNSADQASLKSLITPGGVIKDVGGSVSGSIVVGYQDKNWQTSLQGCEPQYETMRAAKPISGRFFTAKEDQERARVCLLGATVIKNLYPPGFDPTGTTIKLNKNDFEVLGVLPIKGASFRDQDDVVAVPLQTSMYRVLGLTTINSFDVEAVSSDKVPAAMDEVTQMLRHMRHIRPGAADDFTVRNMAEFQAAQADTANILGMLMTVAAAVSLLVGGIGIMNIMLVSVRERTKEIGLRKALGARNMEVLFQFLVEAVLIGLVGGSIGIVMGILWAVTTSLLLGWPILMSWAVVIISVFISAAIGVLAGIWPAWQASRLSPIEALRYE